MHEWSAEVVVDRDLAYRLIAEQFDAIQPAELRMSSEGWDKARSREAATQRSRPDERVSGEGKRYAA